MKLTETQKLKLENLYLKVGLLEKDYSEVQRELQKTAQEYNLELEGVCKSKKIDPKKAKIDFNTGEISEVEDA